VRAHGRSEPPMTEARRQSRVPVPGGRLGRRSEGCLAVVFKRAARDLGGAQQVTAVGLVKFELEGDPSALTPGNQIAIIAYSGSSAHSVSYTYDADGSKTAMTDATGTSSYAYDSFGELTSATSGANQTVVYAYDADGDTTGITYPLPATWATTVDRPLNTPPGGSA